MYKANPTDHSKLFLSFHFLFLFPFLFQMVMKDDLGHQDLQMQEVKSELSETKAELRAVKTGRSEVKSKLEPKLVQINQSPEKT